MKKKIIHYISVLLAFLMGAAFMGYTTHMGNRDMTGTMASATLPVAYAEVNGQLCNEMHGYVEEMDGAYMRDSIIGVSEDHLLSLAVEKYNAQIQNISYEIRSLDMERLIQDGAGLETEDDGQYVRFSVELRDLLDEGEQYLLVLTVQTDTQEQVHYYSLLTYLGENYMQECLDFALEFHEVTVQKDTESNYLNYLEPNGTMSGDSLGYVNIHSRSGPITWGDVNIRQTTQTQITWTEVGTSVCSVVMDYQVENTDTGELYQVREAIRMRYTSSRMYLLAYERTADTVFEAGTQLVEDGEIAFGIQSEELNCLKNEEENVVAFVQQGQLWVYDFGQNRLSLVYGFADGEDQRGLYDAHDFRILSVDESGSVEFLVCGYMNRGNYEGRCGILLCSYDALLNTVEEQFFLESERPYEALKEELGQIAMVNQDGTAWLTYKEMILQIDLETRSAEVLAENVSADSIRVSDDGTLAAWTNEEQTEICLLNMSTGGSSRIQAEDGEKLRALGFMEEDFIYGTARQSDICSDEAGQETFPMYRVIIRAQDGSEMREFDYSSMGKYVTEISIVENRIDLSCVEKSEDGSYTEALPEPITYTMETTEDALSLETVYDDVKRNEYYLSYTGTIKSGSMKRPSVKLVLYEDSRELVPGAEGTDLYLAYSFDGKVTGYETLPEAVISAYDSMGSVWQGERRLWKRGTTQTRVTLSGFDEAEEIAGNSALEKCLQRLLKEAQNYTDVSACRAVGMSVQEICEQELGENACILPGCTLEMALWYVDQGTPVLILTGDEDALLIVGYDSSNIVCWDPDSSGLRTMGRSDSATQFEEAGNLFFAYLKKS
ncbi:MAG: hypothetical protein LIO67_07080 [Lachnospiraceae bacterium]|nr:hypothetical protein [Lachnospiraceae bacterium]